MAKIVGIYKFLTVFHIFLNSPFELSVDCVSTHVSAAFSLQFINVFMTKEI